eukprot:m.292178 g.292178  ORF g.292178 m.292178 type:complete len:682 (+) comp55110_c0_seq1:493-2538(+)
MDPSNSPAFGPPRASAAPFPMIVSQRVPEARTETNDIHLTALPATMPMSFLERAPSEGPSSATDAVLRAPLHSQLHMSGGNTPPHRHAPPPLLLRTSAEPHALMWQPPYSIEAPRHGPVATLSSISASTFPSPYSSHALDSGPIALGSSPEGTLMKPHSASQDGAPLVPAHQSLVRASPLGLPQSASPRTIMPTGPYPMPMIPALKQEEDGHVDEHQTGRDPSIASLEAKHLCLQAQTNLIEQRRQHLVLLQQHTHFQRIQLAEDIRELSRLQQLTEFAQFNFMRTQRAEQALLQDVDSLRKSEQDLEHSTRAQQISLSALSQEVDSSPPSLARGSQHSPTLAPDSSLQLSASDHPLQASVSSSTPSTCSVQSVTSTGGQPPLSASTSGLDGGQVPRPSSGAGLIDRRPSMDPGLATQPPPLLRMESPSRPHAYYQRDDARPRNPAWEFADHNVAPVKRKHQARPTRNFAKSNVGILDPFVLCDSCFGSSLMERVGRPLISFRTATQEQLDLEDGMCTVCGDTFLPPRPPARDFMCYRCGSRFTSAQKFLSHSTTHTKLNFFYCSPCRKSYVCQRSLHTHQKTFHPQEYQQLLLKRRAQKDLLRNAQEHKRAPLSPLSEDSGADMVKHERDSVAEDPGAEDAPRESFADPATEICSTSAHSFGKRRAADEDSDEDVISEEE